MQNQSSYVKPIMTKSSPQLIRSAVVCALAMAAFALASPAIEARHDGGAPAIADADADQPALAATAGSLVP